MKPNRAFIYIALTHQIGLHQDNETMETVRTQNERKRSTTTENKEKAVSLCLISKLGKNFSEPSISHRLNERLCDVRPKLKHSIPRDNQYFQYLFCLE